MEDEWGGERLSPCGGGREEWRATALIRAESMTERLRDADYVAEQLGVPRSWVYRAARCGALPSVRCGRYRRFAERDIERWIEEQRSTARQQEGQHER